MDNFETLTFSESGKVARVELGLSHINMKVVRELTAVCDYLEDESESRAVVFSGSGADFCQGIDFGEFNPDKPMDIHGFNKWEKICCRIERLPKATIAAVRGRAVGGGMQLALVADARVATTDATFQLNEVGLGFLPGMATFRLAKYVGIGHAKRLIMQCTQLPAAEAARLGFIDEVVDNLEDGINKTIEAFGPIHTVAIELSRRLLNESYSTHYEDAIGNFLAAQHRAISQAAFLDTLKKHHED